VHAAADAARRLVNGGSDAGVLKRERGIQAGDATAADDRDPTLL